MRRRLTASSLCMLFLVLFSFSLAIAKPERPVILIPGILGSKLCIGAQVVWGTLDAFHEFSRLDLLAPNANSVVPCGLVDKINVLGPFWAVHQYDFLLKELERLGYAKNRDLFVFVYDWRKSNFESARLLKEFVDGEPSLRNGEFDIVAHSMGGLVTQIYLRRNIGSERVRKVIYLGTPFRGAMNSMGTLSDGWGAFGNTVLGGIDTIRRVLLSFESFYELLPRYDSCCRMGRPDVPGELTYLDILNPAIWRRYEWLPAEYKDGVRATHFDKGISQAKALDAILSVPPSVDVQERRIAGDAIATRLYLYVSSTLPSWKQWSFTSSRGDGTVPVWSAAGSNDLSASDPSFAEHATIFHDAWVANKLMRELVSNAPPPISGYVVGAVSTKTGRKTLRLVDVRVQDAVVRPEGRVRGEIEIQFGELITRAAFVPTVELQAKARAVPVAIQEITSEGDLQRRSLRYSFALVAPLEPDVYRVTIGIGDGRSHSVYFMVSNYE